jgi:hypothetical protein
LRSKIWASSVYLTILPPQIGALNGVELSQITG